MTITTYSFNNSDRLSIGVTAEGELRLTIGGTRNNFLVLSNTNTEPRFVEVVDVALLYSVLVADSLELGEPPLNSGRVLRFLSVDLLD